MKKKRILAVFISLLLCLATASPAFAQTIMKGRTACIAARS